MLRHTRLAQTILCLCLTLICGLGSSLADDVPPPLGAFLQHPEAWGFSQVEILVWNFCATAVIEYFLICGLLGWPERAWLKLIPVVLHINFITKTQPQAGAIFFGRVMPSEGSAWAMVGLIEIAVMAVEFGLLRWMLGKLYRRGALDAPVTALSTILIVVIANVASFAFGFVGLIGMLIDSGHDNLVQTGIR
jgi:hypothetical protein